MIKRIFSTILVLMIGFSVINLEAVEEQSYGSSAGGFEKVGASGAQFLKVPTGARATGMGGAYSSVANDLTSIFWNPAGLADVNAIAANFSYTQWFADFNHSFAAFSLPFGDQFTMALSLVSLSSGEIPVTTINKPEGDGSYYQVQDVSVGFTFSGYLTDQFSFGLTGKYIRTGFASVASSGISFDIGTMYQTGIQGIKLGFAIMNLGTEQTLEGSDLGTTLKIHENLNASPLDAKYDASSFGLPLAFRAGITSDIIETEEHHLIAAGDFTTFSDVPEQFALGSEYTWNDIFSVRAGYVFGSDAAGFSWGAGINYLGGGFNGQINYSMNPMQFFGLVNRLSVAISMD